MSFREAQDLCVQKQIASRDFVLVAYHTVPNEIIFLLLALAITLGMFYVICITVHVNAIKRIPERV